jgi:hypothetical protein
MVARRLWAAARAIAAGWAAVLLIAILAVRPLAWISARLGPSWAPTFHLAFQCGAIAATGWTIGRLNRQAPLLTASVFAATLGFGNFEELLGVDIPWLVRLSRDAMSDARFLESWITTVVAHVFLFGCLFAGARLSRARAKPLSISSGIMLAWLV